MSVLICPKCGEKLNTDNKTMACENGHCFDIAKEGYVNLLLGSKPGDQRGDSKESARARHELLSKDYYKCLKDAIKEKMKGTVLDICCGEGYYDEYDGELFGFDISKEMIRLASKRYPSNNYFVANLASIPVKDKSIDTAIHLFAPFNESEFSRILKDDGTLLSVIPGENHLFEMKELLYQNPYKNDEKAPETTSALSLISTEKITEKVLINQQDLWTLFSMTPYFYRTSDTDKQKLKSVDNLSLTLEFLILEYKK